MLIEEDGRQLSIMITLTEYKQLIGSPGFLVQLYGERQLYVHCDVGNHRQKPEAARNSREDLIVWLPIHWLLGRRPTGKRPLRLTFPTSPITGFREFLAPARVKAGARAVQGMEEKGD